MAKVIELATAPPLRRKPPALPVPPVLQEVPEAQGGRNRTAAYSPTLLKAATYAVTDNALSRFVFPLKLEQILGRRRFSLVTCR